MLVWIGLAVGVIFRMHTYRKANYPLSLTLNMIVFTLVALFYAIANPVESSNLGVIFVTNPCGISAIILFFGLYKNWFSGDLGWAKLFLFLLLCWVSLNLVTVVAKNGLYVVGPSILAMGLWVLAFFILGYFHAWLGPVIAGFNLGLLLDMACLGYDAQWSQWTSVVDFLAMDYPWLRWVVVLFSCLLSLVGYIDRLELPDLPSLFS